VTLDAGQNHIRHRGIAALATSSSFASARSRPNVYVLPTCLSPRRARGQMFMFSKCLCFAHASAFRTLSHAIRRALRRVRRGDLIVQVSDVSFALLLGRVLQIAQGCARDARSRRRIARDECDLKRRRREKTDDERRARAIETTCEPVRASTAPAVAERANETREQPSRAFEEDSEDELGTRARREDLQRVADDASVREKLRSERLREIIRAIDAAKDGEKALAKAREDPEFRAFTEDALSLFER